MYSIIDYIRVMCVRVHRHSINSQLQGYSRCMDDLSMRLDSIEGEGIFTSDGGGHRPLSVVMYDTLALQVKAYG